jgi:hypothetical protein
MVQGRGDIEVRSSVLEDEGGMTCSVVQAGVRGLEARCQGWVMVLCG